MREYNIIDIESNLIKGVEVYKYSDYERQGNKWMESTLITSFKTGKISGGIFKANLNKPYIFNKIEYHTDDEIFYFVSGTAIMIFADIDNGTVDMNSIQIVRIKQGTQIVVKAGKGHVIESSEEKEPMYTVVVAPKMEAKWATLSEKVQGVIS